MLTVVTIQTSLRILMTTYVISTYAKLAMPPNTETTLTFTPMELVTFLWTYITYV
jgi:hypothetical protein